MIIIGLIGFAVGDWKFGAVMAGLGLVLLLLVSLVANHFRTKRSGNRRST
jgi:hypothetical protein